MPRLPTPGASEPDQPASPQPDALSVDAVYAQAKAPDPAAWASDWTAGIGRRLRAARLAAGLSTQHVAEKTADLGYPMARASIGNLETRPREKIYLQDIAVLAAAIGVAPVEILYPLEVTTAPTPTPTPVGVIQRGVLKNTSMHVLPGRTERATTAAGWFTGGYGRVMEARLAAITAYGKFEARYQLFVMLNQEQAAGTLASRTEFAGHPQPIGYMSVLWMEMYDLANWALDAIRTHDNLAMRTGDHRPAVTDKERILVTEVADLRPPDYIEDPRQRRYVQGVLTIGAAEPGGMPYYLQDLDDPWTPPDLTRPTAAYEPRPMPELRQPTADTPQPPRQQRKTPSPPSGPPRQSRGGGRSGPGL
ncbi:hypothetical protein GCM10028784_39340 [Myceligenerans cantabricum]